MKDKAIYEAPKLEQPQNYVLIVGCSPHVTPLGLPTPSDFLCELSDFSEQGN